MRKVTKVPWRRAAEDRDCGAAAFACVASYYGHHVSTEEARSMVNTDRTGTTMRWLCVGARSIGLNAVGVRATYDALAQLPLPTIVHFDEADGHYLVLTGWSEKAVNLIDPSVGPMRMRRSAFEQSFSGFAIQISPTDHLIAKQPLFEGKSEMRRMASRSWPILLVLSLLLGVGTALGLLISHQLAGAIDVVLRGESAELVRLSGVLVGATVFVFAAQIYRLWLVGRLGERIDARLGADFLTSIKGAPVRNFEERCPVAFGGRVAETAAVRRALTVSTSDILGSLFALAIAFAILFSLSPWLAAVSLLILPIIFVISRITQRYGRLAEFESVRKSYNLLTRLVDTFTEFHTVKMFNAEDEQAGLLTERFAEHARAQHRLVVVRGIPMALSNLLVALANTAVVLTVATLASAGTLSAGGTILGFGAAGVVFTAIQRFPGVLVQWEEAAISLERLLEIIHMPKEVNRDVPFEKATAQTVSPALRFDGVTFSYNSVTPVLSDLHIDVAPGETVAIVGATGSGKTSIARLLAGFEEVTSGSIHLGNRNLAHENPGFGRDRIGVVFQDTRLLSRSLYDNLTLGLGDVSDDDIRRALMTARIQDVVDQQRLGLATHASRAGRNFSSGQGQRFALARALLRDPAILVLDEATANIDSRLETEILTDVLAQRKGRTTMIIAHRLATLTHVDRIVVLEEGAVVQSGTYQELVADVAGPFYGLFVHQMDPDSPTRIPIS